MSLALDDLGMGYHAYSPQKSCEQHGTSSYVPCADCGPVPDAAKAFVLACQPRRQRARRARPQLSARPALAECERSQEREALQLCWRKRDLLAQPRALPVLPHDHSRLPCGCRSLWVGRPPKAWDTRRSRLQWSSERLPLTMVNARRQSSGPLVRTPRGKCLY